MKIQRLYAEFAIFSLAVVVLFVVGSASVSSDPFLGISPQDEKFYKSSEIIQCKNGSKKFTRAQLNDDFCDCPDGTDEPGTSACPEGKFFCRNAGHLPISLFSSRVNDGICDCCDGSDEYGGKVKCPNTCWEAGKVARDKLKKNIAMYQKGVTKREQEVEQAKQAISKDEAELSKLKKEEKMLTGIVNKLRERKEQIEKMEEKERLKKEKEEKMKADAKEKADKENPEADDKAKEEKETMETPQDNEIETLEEPTLDQNEKDEFHNTEELSREELGRIVASRWTGESTGHQAKEMDAATTDAEANDETPESIHDEDFNKYVSDIEEEGPTHGEDGMEDNMDESIVEDDHDGSTASHMPNLIGQKDSSVNDMSIDMTIVSNPSWLDKIWKIVENIFKPVISFQTPVDISDAARVREEYYDSSTKLSDIQSRISSLTEKLKHDCGVEKEFYLFHDRCFEMKQNKYLYKVCPFKDASQEEGHSRTQLGYWEKFENAHSIMLFSNGNTCWNGPDRSLKVKLTCGLKTELTDVGEPSRCEYVGLMSTPLLCLEGKLKELEHRLELMNKEQPQSHDEL